MENLIGHGYPTPNTVGEVGQHYEDIDTGDIYECRIASKYSPTHGWPVGGYIWERRAKGEDIQEIYGAGGGSGGNADWNQNNPNAPDYVKNRPFYTGDPVETVLIEETTNEWTAVGFEGAFTLAPIDIVEGEKYFVTFDGTEYECTAYVATGPNSPSVGDGAIADAGNDGSNGEPFFITVCNGVTMIIVGETGEHTVSVVTSVEENHKIDRKYMPDSVVFAPTDPTCCAYLFLINNLFRFTPLGGDDAYKFFKSKYDGKEEILPATPDEWVKILAVFHAAKEGRLVLYRYDSTTKPILLNTSFTTPTEGIYNDGDVDTILYYDEENGVIVKTG